MPPPAGVLMVTGDQNSPPERCLIFHLIDDLVVGREYVVGELHLHNRPQTVDSHTEGGRRDAAFGERGVEDSVRSVFLLESVGGSENASEVADILAIDDYVGVILKHVV